MMTNQNTEEGTRVRVTVYGVEQTGTVEHVRAMAWVRMDDTKRLRWFHWESLSPLEAR